MPKNYKLHYLPIAFNDLDEILDYILEDDPAAALETIEKIRGFIEKLESFPKIGSIPKDTRLERLGNRVLIVDDYLIFYVIDGDVVRIRRIIHGSRNYNHLL